MSRRGAAFYILALMALATSILLPRGFMAARGHDGMVRIVMCTGYGPVTMAVPEAMAGKAHGQGQHQGEDQQSHHGMACPYAGTAAPLSAPGSYEIAMPRMDHGPLLVARLSADIIPGRGMAAPPPPSHAPPFALI